MSEEWIKQHTVDARAHLASAEARNHRRDQMRALYIVCQIMNDE